MISYYSMMIFMLPFNSARIKDDVEYNDIAIAATESDDIIRGIDQQIKRNAKSR